MVSKLRKHSSLFLIIAYSFISFQLMSLSLRKPEIPKLGWSLLENIFSPIRKSIYEISQTSDYVWKRYVWLKDVSLQKDVLEIQLKELKSKNLSLTELEYENKSLRTILDFTEKSNSKGIVSQVISKEPSNWLMTLTINKGSKDGIKEFLPVTDGIGIVGKIAAVAETTSTVLLATDTSSSIGVLLQNSRLTGLAEGTLKKDLLELNYIDTSSGIAISKGEKVLTSGMDGIFKKGYLVGEIVEVGNKIDGLFQKILVKPVVDFSTIENVFIITESKDIEIPFEMPTEQTIVEKIKEKDDKTIDKIVSKNKTKLTDSN